MLPSMGSGDIAPSELKKVLEEHRQHLDSSLEGFQHRHEGFLQRQEDLLTQFLDRFGTESVLSPGSPLSIGGSPTSEATGAPRTTSIGSVRSVRTPPSPSAAKRWRQSANLASSSFLSSRSGENGSGRTFGSGRVGNPRNAGSMESPAEQQWSADAEQSGAPPANDIQGGASDPELAQHAVAAVHHGEHGRRSRPTALSRLGIRSPKGRKSPSRPTARKRRAAVAVEDPFEPAQRAILGITEKPHIKKLVTDQVDKWRLPASWKRFLSRTDGPFSKLVKRRTFAVLANILILANVVFIAVEAQHRVARAQEALGPEPQYIMTDTVFCILFALELSVRLIGERAAFFVSEDWKWNIMDLVFVSTDVLNEVLALLAESGDGGGFLSTAASIQGSARTLRLVRAMRAFRALRVLVRLPQVRQMVHELVNSLVPVIWCVMLLAVVLLFFALIFMQAAADCLEGTVSSTTGAELWSRFESLQVSALSLFKVFTGGIAWEPLHSALMDVSAFYGVCFILFVAIVVLAFLNIVAATFVLSGMRTKAQKDAEDAHAASIEVSKMIDDFGCMQEGGMVNLEDLTDLLEVPQVKYYLATVNLNGANVRAIFDLLDSQGHKAVRAEELAKGCAQFAGPVRGSDLIATVLATRLLSTQLQSLNSFVDSRLTGIEEAL